MPIFGCFYLSRVPKRDRLSSADMFDFQKSSISLSYW